MVRKKKPAGSSRIDPQRVRVLIKVFRQAGYKVTRQSGSHIILRHDSRGKSLSIPDHAGQDVQPFLIKRLIKQADITRDDYLRYLRQIIS